MGNDINIMQTPTFILMSVKEAFFLSSSVSPTAIPIYNKE
jgi:hypothetical protein